MTRWNHIPDDLRDKVKNKSQSEKKSDENDREVIILPGRPITKKNSMQIIKKKNGKPSVIQSEQYREYEKMCLWQLKGSNHKTFEGVPLHVKCLYWMPNKRSWPDLIGLMQASWDILEKGGIVDDDQNIVSPDGSRIMGVDENNPRAEIFIQEVED